MSQHLLVAEDSPTQADALREDLERAGFRVTVAADGQEALDLIGQTHFDLVVSDIVMPRMDGFTLCSRIKAHPDLRDLPVILLTSLRDPLDIIRGLEVAADNFLTKPYEAEQVVLRIKAMLASRQLRLEGRMQMGVELSFMGRNFTITAQRQQILDLLVSAFEDLVQTNSRLLEREDELAEARDVLADQLQQTEEERARLRSVLSAIPDSVFIVDAGGTVTDVNPAGSLLLDRELDDLVGQPVAALVTVVDDEERVIEPQDWPIVRATAGVATAASREFQIRFDGRSVPISITAAPIRGGDGAVTSAVGVVRDLSVAPLVDALTGLSNRSLFGDRLERAVAGAQRRGGGVAVLRVSLDRFTVVNDTLGREAESALLIAAAQRLQVSVRDDATVARLRGDDFAILLEEVEDAAEVIRVADRLQEAMKPSFAVGPQEIFLTASVGIAMTGAGEVTADALLHQANVALHRAIEHGGSRHELFDEAINVAALRRLQLETDLRRAIDREEFVVHYQPVVELASGRVVECEALVRWVHPQHGLVAPMDFIPLAEETGLILTAGMWVLGEACRQTRTWQDELGEPIRIAVNLSARQFEDPGLIDGVVAALESANLDPAALVLEITETAVIRDPQRAVATLSKLHDVGVRLAIDDFGTGYSSLNYLKTFPVDVLKIDRSFTQRLGEASEDTAIVQAVLSLAQGLGMTVTAEGVETVDQLAWLERSGDCELAAGYLFSKPLPAEKVTGLLSRSFAGFTR